MFTDFRLKFRRFFRKNAKIIFLVVGIWAIVFFINLFLKSYEPSVELQTTYEPHTSVMDSTSSVPKQVSNEVEEMLKKYINYCFEGNVQSAYDMLSDVCKEASFHNDIDEFTAYVQNKMVSSKKYAIQDYSNNGNTYIYQIKYSEDMLATGLTNSDYKFTEEKIIFKRQKDGSLEMSVGNFIDYEEIKNISENDYLKIDVKSVQKYYSIERYTVKFTNRSDYTVVIADGQADNEIFLKLNSTDARDATIDELVLKPNESKLIDLEFKKFYDNDDNSQSLNFGSIRVMEQYSGTDGVSDETIQSEIQNAVAKFSTSIPINK